MAIFFDKIKMLSALSDIEGESASKQYDFKITYNDGIHLWTNSIPTIPGNNDWKTDKNLGRVLTSKMGTEPYAVESVFSFTNGIKFGDILIDKKENVLNVNSDLKVENIIVNNNIRGKTSTITESFSVGSSGELLTVNNDGVSTKKSITVENGSHISAAYFNATSDRRAKENIKEVDINALDIINSTPLYTYTYKNAPGQVSLGVMAQDLLNKPINDFSLVENPWANGVDGDYMSVKESKIVFLLWKAIQEQQAEIKELKLKLNAK